VGWIWWVLLWCGCFGNGKQHSLTTLTEVFPCFSSVLRQMPGLNSQSRGTDRISSELLSFVLCLSLCYAIVFMLFCCYCVVLLFVLSYVLIVCTVPLPPGINPIAVDKYINMSQGGIYYGSVTRFIIKQHLFYKEGFVKFLVKEYFFLRIFHSAHYEYFTII